MQDLTGRIIGKYKILEEIGSGGMAVVYKAIDESILKRVVAIKVIKPDKSSSERFYKRFVKEAKVLSNLSHMNIVKVFDYGDVEGLPYLVMEYIPSGSLSKNISSPMELEQALKLIIPISRALSYVHSKNIIHRDVKPANILINDVGQPLLSDFGILKMIDTEESQVITSTGMIVGTTSYMSPEQIQGEKNIDFRTDVYSLGVLFYQLLTGQLPYNGNSAIEIATKHINEPIPRAKQINRDLPFEVDHVISKAMAKNREDRYQTMEAFGTALENLTTKGVRNGLVQTSKIPKFSIEEKKTKKNKFLLFLTLGIICLLIVTYLLWMNNIIFPKSNQTIVNNNSLTANIPIIETPSPTITQINTKTLAINPTNTPTESEPEIMNVTELPTNIFTKITTDNIVEINRLERISILGFDWVKDQNLIVNFGSTGISIIDPSAMGIIQRISLGGEVPNAFTVTKNGEFAYVLIRTNLFKYDLLNQKLVNEYAISNGTYSIAVSNDGEMIGLGNLDNKVQIINSENGRLLSTFRSNYGGWSITFSPDDKLIAAGTSQGALLWELDSGLWIPLQSGQNKKVNCLSFSEDNTLLAGGSNNSIFVWEIPSGNLKNEFIGEFGNINGVDFSTDNELLVGGADNSQVIIWNLESGKLDKTLLGHSSKVFNVKFSPDGKFVVSGANEGVMRLWGNP